MNRPQDERRMWMPCQGCPCKELGQNLLSNVANSLLDLLNVILYIINIYCIFSIALSPGHGYRSMVILSSQDNSIRIDTVLEVQLLVEKAMRFVS